MLDYALAFRRLSGFRSSEFNELLTNFGEILTNSANSDKLKSNSKKKSDDVLTIFFVFETKFDEKSSTIC